MAKRVTKAIFPIAGLGTRLLPATKSVPKEMMTLVDRPVIQYAIDEARAAGIEEFIFVTSRGKSALEDYFDSAPHIEEELRARGKDEMLAVIKSTNMPSGAVAYVRQQRPLGLGHAVWCARRLIGDEPFAVILPDDVISAQTSCLAQMIEAHVETRGNIVAAMEVPREMTNAYGILDVEHPEERFSKVRGMVEKPEPSEAPSTLAVIGRYILTPKVLLNLDRCEKGVGGEVQLTDAIATEISGRAGVYGYRFEGERFDCGSKAGFLRGTVAFGLKHPNLAPEFNTFLDNLAARRSSR
jgi:UTP--glucose-1-phosphate uridylyltransferase